MSGVQAVFPWQSVLETAGEGEVVASSREQARPGVAAPLPDEIHPALYEALSAAGIDALWSHQADALEMAHRGHTIVTTGTASGKSLAFNLPVLNTLATDRKARAFYLYPTKALAQ
ncbi:MAG TPA: DEAD/DEAH box helicase, partial [Thermoleophilaceae bacterium]|nr:DEAD/DEAH box helicase [Thermoleophilaceae bacterium]